MMKSKKWLVALSVVGLLAASGIVMAATADKQAADNNRPCFSQKGDFVHRGDRKGFQEDRQAMLDFLKIDAETFKNELKAGKTLMTIADEKGISEQNLKAFMVERMTQRIDEGVNAGRIDEDRAAQMKANMDQRISDMINGKAPMHRDGHKRGPGMFQDAQLLDLLKVDAETLKNEMKDGKTLVAVANEQGISEQDLKAFMIERMTQRIDEGVNAGRIDEDRAAQMKANMDQRVSDMINGKAPMHKDGHKRGPGMFQDAQLLDLLKVDAETLKDEMRDGKTLVAVANEKGISEQDLKAFMVERMTQRIDEDVNAGRIDEDRAAQMKTNMDQRVSDMINGKCPQPGQKPGPRPQE